MIETESEASIQDYALLDPDTIIDAIESAGLIPDGRALALNSYENRVYQIGIEEEPPIIAKFYRPGRWSNTQILEEHQFCAELVEAELPIVKPTEIKGETLFSFNTFRFALYPRQGGRAPEFDNADNLLTMGRFLGRIHAIGGSQKFSHRPSITVQSFGYDSAEIILRKFIPPSLKEAYETLSRDLLKIVDERIHAYTQIKNIRTHGDCHSGNVLWRDDAPHFVDFDDARTAPAVQDLWMLLSGSIQEQELQLSEVVEGYNEFNTFNVVELNIVEALRSLRIMHYAAWLARRWSDPAFPKAFPWFNTERYWGEHILELREQLAAMQEPPLRLL